MVDEVEQTVVGPVHVLEDHDERTPFGEALEEHAPRRRALTAAAAVIDTDERQQVVGHPSALRLLCHELLDARAQLGGARVRWVVLRDPGLRLHHLCHCPEADAVAVGQGAALPPPHEIRVALEVRKERADET